MLTATRQADQAKVLARDAKKPEAPFICPRCRAEVVLRKGRIKTHHFAHKPPVTCAMGAGETAQHLAAKQEIFDALLGEPRVTGVELEKDFGVSVADVFAVISGTKVAVEIQRSTLSVAEIIARTVNYHRLGISVLWIGLPNQDLSSSRYSPRAWEKWAHAAYFGRIYVWVQGQTLEAYHLDKYKIYVEESSWHGPGGSEESAGGYERVSRRWRTPRWIREVDIATDFAPTRRASWAGGTVSVPQCSLYVDKRDPS